MSAASPGQTRLIERLRDVLASDARVESAWLRGSFGHGVADQWSDVDVLVQVDAADIPACAAEYGGPRNPVGETVFMQVLKGRVVTAITPDWERYDIDFVNPIEFRTHSAAGLRPLVPGDGAPGRAGKASAHPQRRISDPARVLALCSEFLRDLGLMSVSIGREEWLVGMEGVEMLRRITIDLMLEINAVARSVRGEKRLNPFLSPDQRRALEAVTGPAPGRASLMASVAGLAAIFIPLGRQACADAGVVWPEHFEAATRRYLLKELSLVI